MSARCFQRLIPKGCRRLSSHGGLTNIPKTITVQPSCICSLHEYHTSNWREVFQSRHFSTSSVSRAGKVQVANSFDEYYSAVIEAHASDHRLRQYRYHEMSENPVERDVQLKRWLFAEAVDIYIEKTDTAHAAGLRKGHMDFITQALKRMPELGVQKDLDCYNAILKVFPPEIMKPTTMWQVEFQHYPKQQNLAVLVLEQMEDNAVIPSQQTRNILEERFGDESHPVRKFRRMVYWMRKFQHANPFPLPQYLPLDPIELAILALKKISVDLENEIKVYKVKEQDEDTFIASAQSPTQRDMIKRHPLSIPLYVEGGFKVWLRDKQQTYFVLKADCDPKLFNYPTRQEEEDNLDFETIFDSEEPKELVTRPNIHQQEDGSILGLCITETSTKDSLISWIRCLQDKNPNLENIPILITLQTPDLEEEKLFIEVNEKLPPASQTEDGVK